MLQKVVKEDMLNVLVHTLDSEDERVRKYAKVLLHRSFGRLVAHRSHIKSVK